VAVMTLDDWLGNLSGNLFVLSRVPRDPNGRPTLFIGLTRSVVKIGSSSKYQPSASPLSANELRRREATARGRIVQRQAAKIDESPGQLVNNPRFDMKT